MHVIATSGRMRRSAGAVVVVMATFLGLLLAAGPASSTEPESVSEPASSGSFLGAIDDLLPAPGGVVVRGWARTASVLVYVDGQAILLDTVDARPDVVERFPELGPNQGFHATLGAAPGAHRVCVYAFGAGLIDCRDITVLGPATIGALDDAASTFLNPGTVWVRGWAIDPSTADPVDVLVYVDGGAVVVAADVPRGDLSFTFPGYGPAHAFQVELGLPGGQTPGRHRVCAYGLGSAGTVLLGCRDIEIENHAVLGNLDAVIPGAGSVRVAGWAIEPDNDESKPTTVHLYVDDVAIAVAADAYRPDVPLVATGWGDHHGFDATLGATPGPHRVCAFGIDSAGGPNTLLGCRTVTVS